MRARSQQVTVAMTDLVTLEKTILTDIAAASDEALAGHPFPATIAGVKR